MYQVFTNGMSPVHGAPNGAVGVMLVKEVVLALVVNHAVGVVHPAGRRGKMKLGPVQLPEGG